MIKKKKLIFLFQQEMLTLLGKDALSVIVEFLDQRDVARLQRVCKPLQKALKKRMCEYIEFLEQKAEVIQIPHGCISSNRDYTFDLYAHILVKKLFNITTAQDDYVDMVFGDMTNLLWRILQKYKTFKEYTCICYRTLSDDTYTYFYINNIFTGNYNIIDIYKYPLHFIEYSWEEDYLHILLKEPVIHRNGKYYIDIIQSGFLELLATESRPSNLKVSYSLQSRKYDIADFININEQQIHHVQNAIVNCVDKKGTVLYLC